MVGAIRFALQQRGECDPVLHVGCCDDGGDQDTGRVDQHVPFDPVDFLSAVEAARPGHRRCFDRQGVDDGRSWPAPSARAGGDFAADRGKDSRPGAVAAPAQEMFVCGRPPHGEVMRQMPPRTSGAQHVQNGVEVFAPPLRWAGPSTLAVRWDKEAGDARPRGVGQIGAVPSAPLTRFRVT